MSNVSAFPKYILKDLPEALRLLATKIELGEVDAIRAVITLQNQYGTVDYRAFGEDFSIAHAVGLVEVTKHLMIGTVE